jgi:hypothetical protein
MYGNNGVFVILTNSMDVLKDSYKTLNDILWVDRSFYHPKGLTDVL